MKAIEAELAVEEALSPEVQAADAELHRLLQPPAEEASPGHDLEWPGVGRRYAFFWNVLG